MIIKEIEAKSILRKRPKIDSWFISHYGMNLYRGCTHNCAYCDGRAEGYYVSGEFGENVAVKVNAIKVLRRELDPTRKRIPFRRSFIMMGGGVGDSYQPVEKKYQLTRQTLKLLSDYDWPVHVLTKSILVKRDMDILKSINQQSRVMVSFSFSSVSNEVSSLFEPGVPLPDKRLETLAAFKKEGIACGMFLLPTIPFLTDTPEVMEETIRKACETGVDFIIFGGMTLKTGRQEEYFLKILKRTYPHLVTKYQNIYTGNKWGQATEAYRRSIHTLFNNLTRKYGVPTRIPQALYQDLLGENDLVIVILEHIDYLLKLEGRESHYGYAANAIAKVKKPLSTMKEELRQLKGVGEKTEKIIREILDTGSSSYCQALLRHT